VEKSRNFEKHIAISVKVHYTVRVNRTNTSFRFPTDLLEELKDSAKQNYRSLAKEVEFRLRESLKRSPSGATNTLGVDQTSKKGTDHEKST
jgi:hypothetical protein